MADPSIDQSQLPVESPKTKPDRSEYFRQYREKNREQLREKARLAYPERSKEAARERTRRCYQRHKEARKEYGKRYRAENLERVQKHDNERYQKNKERINEKRRRNRADNPERGRQYQKKYRAKNIERVKLYAKRFYTSDHGRIQSLIQTHLRRARKRSTTPIEDQAAINKFTKHVRNAERIKCHWCKKFLDKSDRTIDHIIPLAKGGLHAAINLCCACGHCNFTKHARLPEEISGQGFLAFQ